MPDKKYTRVEEEIIEILDQMENDAPKPKYPHLRVVHPPSSGPTRRRFQLPSLSRVSPSMNLGLVVVFAFVALMSSGIIQVIATVLSLGCLIILFFRRGRPSATASSIDGPRTWRGRDISFTPDDGSSMGGRLRDWIHRVRH